MKRFYTIILALGLMAATAVAQVTHHEVRVGDFTQLVVIDDINVIYRCVPDSAGLAVADCSQAVADGLIFARTGSGRLSIQLSNEVARMRQLPVLTVYSSTLTEAENAGDSTLLVTPIGTRAEKFKVRLSDNGKVISHGLDAQQLELCILTGKGKIIADGQCDKLHAKTDRHGRDPGRPGDGHRRRLPHHGHGHHRLHGERRQSECARRRHGQGVLQGHAGQGERAQTRFDQGDTDALTDAAQHHDMGRMA